MSAASGSKVHFVLFGGERIEFELRRSRRETLAISVRPDTSVLVTAPEGASPEAVAAKVQKRAVWIRRQQGYFAAFLPKVPPRQYMSGETHRYLGRQYRLKVVRGADEAVRLRGRFIWVETVRPKDRGRVRRLVGAWYALHAKVRFARSLAECLARFRGSVSEPRLELRRMPKRWGSWTRRGVIYLNPELVLAPASCIDYVVTHEICHLMHASHGPEFVALLRRVMPDWEKRKDRLESAAAETGWEATACGSGDSGARLGVAKGLRNRVHGSNAPLGPVCHPYRGTPLAQDQVSGAGLSSGGHCG
jgi:predicted metal-dependent hydrolase